MPITLDATFLKHYKSFPLGPSKCIMSKLPLYLPKMTTVMFKIVKFMRSVSACLSTCLTKTEFEIIKFMRSVSACLSTSLTK